MFEHMNFIVNFNNADYSDIIIPYEDKKVLRDLAKKVAELASLPKMDEKKKLWIDHNKLKKTRPVLLCDPENGWNELITDDQILCENSISRHWECHLRKQIFWGKETNDDYVVEPYFDCPHIFKITSWGVRESNHTATAKVRLEDGGAYHIDTILENYSRLKDVTESNLIIDYKLSEIVLNIAHEIFDNILKVRLKTWWFFSVGLTDDFVFLRGMENFMLDMYDHPDKFHELMNMIFTNTMKRLDYLEDNHLLTLNNDGSFVGSGGMGFSDELPGTNFTGNVTTRGMWGCAESQVSIGVSPEMFKEFIFPYQKKLMERFGLTCYGCCEPLDERVDIVKAVKNLRRISVSPWANREVMAEKLKHNYIYSAKPAPSYLAVPHMDEKYVRKDIKNILSYAKDTCLELIMKDNHTLGKNPENLKNWVRIAREEINIL